MGYDEILEAELRDLAELRPARQSPAGEGNDPAKVLKAFDKVLFPKPKIAELSAPEREYFKGLASNKEFIEKWAEDLLQALDTTKSGTLTKEEADPLLRPICERCALYSDQTWMARPRGTGTFWYKVIAELPSLTKTLWDDGMSLYAREARDKPGRLLDVQKTEIDIFDIESLLRNTFIFGMGGLKPDVPKDMNVIYALTYYNYVMRDEYDYERTDPPAEALPAMLAAYDARPKSTAKSSYSYT